ncbi:hypothetical protein HAX54_022625, partial [Datura stramonium]|nr:hypothetical protein [Datura stramonium]
HAPDVMSLARSATFQYGTRCHSCLPRWGVTIFLSQTLILLNSSLSSSSLFLSRRKNTNVSLQELQDSSVSGGFLQV